MAPSRLPSPSSPAWPSYPWLVVGACCIAGLMGQIDASIVQLALPTLGRVFDCTLESVSWVALSYLLGVAAFMPIFGQLCRIFGRKLFYIVGFVLFTSASALCGFAPDLVTLGRASVPARRRRSDDRRQQHGACRRGDG